MIEVVNQNYSFVEPFATIVDDTFLRITCRIDSDMDPYGQQENDEVNKDSIEYSGNLDTDTLKTTEAQLADQENTNSLSNQVRVVPDNVINENMRSLNVQHSEVFKGLHQKFRL